MGTSGALAEIEMELTEVLSDLTALSQAVAVGFSNETFSTLQNTLSADVNLANSITTQLQSLVQQITPPLTLSMRDRLLFPRRSPVWSNFSTTRA